MAIITKDRIEKATISVFVHNPGYRRINSFVQDCTERESETDIVIKYLLKKKLQHLNKHLAAEIIDEAFKQICQSRFNKSVLMAKKEIYNLLKVTSV